MIIPVNGADDRVIADKAVTIFIGVGRKAFLHRTGDANTWADHIGHPILQIFVQCWIISIQAHIDRAIGESGVYTIEKPF